MAGTISNYGDRQQIWNLGNKYNRYKEVSRFRVTSIEMKNHHTLHTKQTLTNENKVYASMKKSLQILCKYSKI